MRARGLAAALAAVLVFSMGDARAESCTWGVVTVGSKHFGVDADRKGRKPDYEEQNWGLGVEHCITKDVRVVAGAYRNSVREESIYAGFGVEFLRLGPVGVGAALVLVSGYEQSWVVAPVPGFVVEGKHLGANLSFMPAKLVDDKAPNVVALQLKWRFR